MKQFYIPTIENNKFRRDSKFFDVLIMTWIVLAAILAITTLFIDYIHPIANGEEFNLSDRMFLNTANLVFISLLISMERFSIQRFITKRMPFIKFDGETLSIRKNAISNVFEIKISDIKDIRLQAIKLVIQDVNDLNHEFSLGEYSYSQIQKVKDLIGVIKNRNATEKVIKTSDPLINN